MSESDDLPEDIMAALRAPEGTTEEDIRAQLAASAEAPSAVDTPAFRARYQDALDDWCERHDRYTVPPAVAAAIADQITADMRWESRSHD